MNDYSNEIHYPWMSDPDIPDPEPIKQCRVNRMTGVSIERYTDYGPFRRCGCKACLVVVKKYDGVPKAERKNPRAVTMVRAAHGDGKPMSEEKREAIMAQLKRKDGKKMCDIADMYGVSRSAVSRIKKVMRDGQSYA